jgi:hypothetical protein
MKCISNFSHLKNFRHKNQIKCKVITTARETVLMDHMRTSLMSRATHENAGRELVVGGIVNNYPVELEDDDWNNDDYAPQPVGKQNISNNPLTYDKPEAKIR